MEEEEEQSRKGLGWRRRVYSKQEQWEERGLFKVKGVRI